MPPKPKPAPERRKDEVEFIDVEQRSAEWFELRRGIPTASNFAAIMAQSDEQAMRSTYVRRVAGEILSGRVCETFRSQAMEHGIEMEPKARAYYARTRLSDLVQIGFVRRKVFPKGLGRPFIVGCSPDAVIAGKRRGLEIKTTEPEKLIGIGLGAVPSLHRAQLQGTMWVCGWDEMDLLFFAEGMDCPTFTFTRDVSYIARLSDEVEKFAWDVEQTVKQYKARWG